MEHSRRLSRSPRKHIRLPAEAYAQTGSICSVTIAVTKRQPVFSDHDAAAAAVAIIREHAQQTGAVIFAYCVMPDHIHPLLSPSPACDIITFVGHSRT